MYISSWTTIYRKEQLNLAIPIWVFAVVVGIVVSALMAIKTGREERMLEQESIEKEGEIFIHRLEQEKEMREQQKAN
jgi:Na+/glutamate symporter